MFNNYNTFITFQRLRECSYSKRSSFFGKIVLLFKKYYKGIIKYKLKGQIVFDMFKTSKDIENLILKKI